MFVCANVAYLAHVLTNGPVPRSLGAYVFTLSRLSRFVGVPTWRAAAAARVVRNTTNAYVYSPVSP